MTITVRVFYLTVITGLYLSLLFQPGTACAHGSADELVRQISCLLEEQPDDPRLFYQRAISYGDLQHTDAALLDLHTALELDPAYDLCHLQLARLYLGQDLAEFAEQHINHFINRNPGNPYAYELRARINHQLGRDTLALADLRQVVRYKHAEAIRPADYLQLAEGTLRLYPENQEEAIRVLQEGIEQLGPVISLQSRIIDLLLEKRDCAGALLGVDQILASGASVEKWCRKKAMILEQDGRMEEARQLPCQPLQQRRSRILSTPARPAFVKFWQNTDTLPRKKPGIQVIRGPYLQAGTTNSMIIKWRTDRPTDSKVWFGPHPANLNNVLMQPDMDTEHEMIISDLFPNIRYYYAIGNSQGLMAGKNGEHFFETSPVVGDTMPIRAWILGDCGTKNDNARAVRDGYYKYAGSHHTDLILLLGDNAYRDGTDREYQKAIFENMYERKLVQSVLWPAPGNHDYHSAEAASQLGPYFDIFSLPKQGEAGGLASGTEAYYAFDYGNIHFVSLDSHDSGRQPGDPMLVWLENDLQATEQDWIVVFFHHPPYSKGSHDSDREPRLIQMRENVLPILEAQGVDLVLSGHSHSYERSYLLNGHYGHSSKLLPSMILDAGDGQRKGAGAYRKYTSGPNQNKGAIYTVAGSSGKISRRASFDHPVMFYSAPILGSVSLEVSNLQLEMKFINVNGKVLDHFSITKSSPIGQAPQISLQSPLTDKHYYWPATIDLKAEAFDADGQVREVLFFVNNQWVGTADRSPYTFKWNLPWHGRFKISARATDNLGNQTSSLPVHVNMNFLILLLTFVALTLVAGVALLSLKKWQIKGIPKIRPRK